MVYKSHNKDLDRMGLVFFGVCGAVFLLLGFLFATGKISGTLFSGSPQQSSAGFISFNISSWINTILNLTNLSRTTHTAPPGNVFIRIRPLDIECNRCSGNAIWALPNYYAENVISLVAYMKPDVLERYTDGPLDANMLVPTAPGDPKMNVAQFLNASMQACNCYMMPRVGLLIGVANAVAQANALYNFPVKPKMRYLSLSDWGPFVKNNSAANITKLFTELYAQGWKGIGINGCGGDIPNASPYATFADVCVDGNNWLPSEPELDIAHSQKNIKKAIMYIDFPSLAQKFSELSPDQQANALNTLAYLQSKDNYTLNYNMLQVISFNTLQNGTLYDTSNIFTSKNSQWGGKSLAKVIKYLQKQYNYIIVNSGG